MGILILVRWRLYIRTAPRRRVPQWWKHQNDSQGMNDLDEKYKPIYGVNESNNFIYVYIYIYIEWWSVWTYENIKLIAFPPTLGFSMILRDQRMGIIFVTWYKILIKLSELLRIVYSIYFHCSRICTRHCAVRVSWCKTSHQVLH